MAQARPTMRDVAAAAGVSLKTVSRVVNQEAGVRATTIDKVTAAIDELGFQRNDLARSLRPGQGSSTLGLVVGDIANPFFASIARAIEEVAHEHGYVLITGSSGEEASYERELVRTFCSRRVDGLLVVPTSTDHGFIGAEIDRGIPVVFVDRPPVELVADVVMLDNAGGARRGVAHLLAQGHRRIGLLADDVIISTARDRVRGYHEALAEAGVPASDPLLRLGCRDVTASEAAVHAMLEQDDPPTALFAINNRMSLGALRALRDRSERVALVGFDDLEYADVLPTPITVVAHDPHAMGRVAADVLFERLGGDTSPPRQIVLPTSLIIRGSGEIPR